MGDLVHPRAVAVGAGVALAICVPAAILAQVLDEAGVTLTGFVRFEVGQH